MDGDGDVQEARIAALFRDAAAGAPPAAFDAAQVAATSRRITRRRRSAVAGAALAVLAVSGVGVVAGLGGPEEATVTAASGPAPAENSGAGSAAGADDAARAMAPEAAAEPDAAVPPVPAVPGAVPPVGTPLGPGTGDCADRQDPALRALVDRALPEVVGAGEAATTMECRPGGERGVAVEAGGGVLSVTYLPPGAAAQRVEGARSAPTASGGTVVVASRPGRAAAPEPFADRLDAVVAFLAPRL